MIRKLGLWEWLRRLLNDRTTCPFCGAWRAGVLFGEWDGEQRECCECKRCWTERYPK